MPERSFVRTADGSLTLYVPQWDEHYHSIHGAMQESMHVFIRAGLEHAAAGRDHTSILEVGFGTGLNAWLTALWTLEQDRHIHYTGLEAYPLTEAEVGHLADEMDVPPQHLELFKSIHAASWGSESMIADRFALFKWKGLLQEWEPDRKYDLVYFDAFAPSAQPELWTEEVFRKLFDCTHEGGILVTYCAKGAVRRAMQAAGWEVSKLPGPPRKREMTRAKHP